MKVEQNAGDFTLRYWTDGYPHWISLEFEGEELRTTLQINDIHDLRYACERIIATFPEKGQ